MMDKGGIVKRGNDDIVHQGWLYKKGRIHKNWTRRWFVLYQKNILSYYSQPPEETGGLEQNKKARKKQAKGSIKLQYCTFIPDGMRDTSYFFSFVVCFGDSSTGGVGLGNAGRNYYIRATKEHDYRAWVDVLMLCCKGESPSEVKAHDNREKGKKKDRGTEKKKKNPQLQKGFYYSIKAKALSPRSTKFPIFAVSLEEVVEREGFPVPLLVEASIQYLETQVETEGLMRLAGAAESIRLMRKRFEAGKKVDMATMNEYGPHAVASLLKLYLRELPEPLLTFALYEPFVKAQLIEDEDARTKIMLNLLASIPEVNRRVLKRLVGLLTKIAAHEAINHMTISNLAIVFTPNFFRREDDNLLQSMKDAPYLLSVTKTFISEYDILFKDEVCEPSGTNEKANTPSESSEPITNLADANPFDNLPASNEETFLLLEVSAFLDGHSGQMIAPENSSVQEDSMLLAELDAFLQQG